jgi:arylsulfatase
VISLDILPTVLDATNVAHPQPQSLDGKSLLPLLSGETKTHHQALFWSEGGSSGEWAVRLADWKLHGQRNQMELFDLAKDPGEVNNLAEKNEAHVKMLRSMYDHWIKQMADPITGGSRYWDQAPRASRAEREKERMKKRNDRKKKRDDLNQATRVDDNDAGGIRQ